LLDLGSSVFESATVDSNILLIQNQKNEGRTISLTAKNSGLNLAKQIQESALIIDFNSDNVWFIGTPFEIKLKEKIEHIGLPLKNWDIIINKGLMTGCNEAFYINESTKNTLEKIDARSSELIFKNFRGREICKYHTPTTVDSYVIVASNYIDIDEYPAVKDHLMKYEDKLKGRAQFIRGDHEWFTVDNCPSEDNLKKYKGLKIIYPNMTQSLHFTIDYSGSFSNDKTFTIVSSEQTIKYLCGVLNSKLLSLYLKASLPKLGNEGYEVRKVFFENTPIPEITSNNVLSVNKIQELVDQILKLKITNKNSDTKSLEAQIDALVYKLYGLSEEEINIIEQSK
jgi:hypothetical protein